MNYVLVGNLGCRETTSNETTEEEGGDRNAAGDCIARPESRDSGLQGTTPNDQETSVLTEATNGKGIGVKVTTGICSPRGRTRFASTS